MWDFSNPHPEAVMVIKWNITLALSFCALDISIHIGMFAYISICRRGACLAC